MQADNALGRAEFLDGFERIDAGTRPVAGIGASTNPFAAAFTNPQDRVRIPVMRRLGMIVQRDADLILFAEFVD